jgi:hypothetical protein
MTIAACLLIALLVAGNGFCALSCAAQPDPNSAPPCHQKPGAKLCRQALPVADVATPAIFDYELPLLSLVETTAPEVQPPNERSAAPLPLPFTLRI